MKNSWALAAGVVIGVGVIIAALVIYLRKRKQLGKNVFGGTTTVDLLTAKIVKNQVENYLHKFGSSSKVLVALLNRKNKDQFFKDIDLELPNEDKNILIAVYDSDRDTILETHLIEFREIDSNLHARLIENDGILVVEE